MTAQRTGLAGLSLVELMTAAGIIGILGTIALPRYHQLMVLSRRGEAKSNLTHIISLQEIYKIDHFNYYSGSAMTGGRGIGYQDGRGSYGVHFCDVDPEKDVGLCNWLGFRPEAHDELRYLYTVHNNGRLARASAASDKDGFWIYPNCRGRIYGYWYECGYKSGDALEMHVNGTQPRVCRNIMEHCPNPKKGASTPSSPPSGGGGGPNNCDSCCNPWSSWSSWTPPRSNTCSTNLVHQTRTRTRSCFGSGSSCLALNCDTTETQDNFTMGLGYTTCNNICGTWSTPPWLPNTNTICQGTPFTQTRTRTRNCGPKPPCVGGPCGTARVRSQNAYGTKRDPCDGSGGLCGAWGAYSSWHPAQNTICAGSSFKQSRSRSRTCDKSRGSCNYDAHCPRTDNAHKNVTGTKTVTCNDICGGWSNPPWSRDAGSVCVNVSFNRHRTNQRNCYPGCTISPSCKSIRYESGTGMGTKTFNDAKCDAVCSSWVESAATKPNRKWFDSNGNKRSPECRTNSGQYTADVARTRTCPALVDTCQYPCKTSETVRKRTNCPAAVSVAHSCIYSTFSRKRTSKYREFYQWIGGGNSGWCLNSRKCQSSEADYYFKRDYYHNRSNSQGKLDADVDADIVKLIEDVIDQCGACSSDCYTLH